MAQTLKSIYGNLGTPESASFLFIKANGNTGQGLSSGWNELTIDTTEYNNITGCSLASNHITLPAGTYYVSVIVVQSKCGSTSVEFQQVTSVKHRCSLSRSNSTGASDTVNTGGFIYEHDGTNYVRLAIYAPTGTHTGRTVDLDTTTEVYLQLYIERLDI